MKFQYLGTAAWEGIPALFCHCDVCRKSRAAGGRALRTRTQAIIDDSLLIDFPPDTYAHVLRFGIDLLHVTDCLITHTHEDHWYVEDFGTLALGFGYPDAGYCLTVHGAAPVGASMRALLDGALGQSGRCVFAEVQPFVPFAAGKYTVTPLPAIHDPGSGPLFYLISDGEKTILYAHDTHYFSDDVWAYLEREKPHIDLASLDCTNACTPMNYVGHMGFAENLRVRDRLVQIGCADANTQFVSNHFSHNGGHAFYDEFVPIAAREGFLVSYDGMTVTV